HLNKFYYIQMVFVNSVFNGLFQWPRSAFMSFYEKMAYDTGCKTLRLDTVISNKKSQAMYKKLGFNTIGQWEGDPNEVGWTLTFIGLEKVLLPK
ncbi:GNAT family N-acetyltransferase, partial [Treponema sp.]|uniref:GNAT family N-acetyltransferase n=1 Tax=Treponema sp. TaxID=166 RepID=UPI0039A2F8B5